MTHVFFYFAVARRVASLMRLAVAAATAGLLVFEGAGATVADQQVNPLPLTQATLSEARTDMAVAGVGTKVLLAGGIGPSRQGRYSDSVDIYDSASNEWRLATLSQPRTGVAAATVGSKVVFAGGFLYGGPGRYSDAVDIFDDATGQWSTARLSVARAPALAVASGSQILVIGASTGGEEAVLDLVDIYDSITGEWSTARLSQKRLRMAAGSDGQHAFIAGGQIQLQGGGASPVDTVDVYDSATRQWSTARLSRAGGDVAIAFANGKMVFAGGPATPESKVVDVYDVATATWSNTFRDYAPGGRVTAISVGSQVLLAEGGTAHVELFDTATGLWKNQGFILSCPEMKCFGTPSVSGVTVGPVAVLLVNGLESDPLHHTLDVYDSRSGRWSSVRLAAARRDPTLVTAGSRALLVGGRLPDRPSGIIEQYDMLARTWRQPVQLSAPRQELAIAVVGARVLFAGGAGPWWMCDAAHPRALLDRNCNSAAVDIYDAATDTWSVATLSSPRVAPAAITVGRRVVFAGGRMRTATGTETDVFSDAVDVYDSVTGRWSAHRMTLPRERVALAAAGSKALVAGGFTDVVDVYDAVADAWSTARLSEARRHVVAASVGSRVLFAGGVSGTAPWGDPRSNTVDIYDSATDEWSTATLSEAREVDAAVTVGTQVLFAAGVTAQPHDATSSGTVDIYDDATGEWSTAHLSDNRRLVRGVAAGSQALFAGGYIGVRLTSRTTDTVDIYDSTTGAWTTASMGWHGCCMATSSVGSVAVLAGGQGGSQGGVLNLNVGMYDSSTGTWSTVPLEQGGASLAVASLGSIVFFAGGTIPSSLTDIVELIDVASAVSVSALAE